MKKGFTLIEFLVVLAIIALCTLTVLSVVKKAHACSNDWIDSPCDSNSQQLDNLATNQAKLVTAVPAPQLQNSLERQNIAKRAETFNKPEKISYIYLISYGKVMAFYPVKGKVSSLNSYMVPQEQLVYGDGTKCNEGSGVSTQRCYVVSAPDIDGSYGQNSNGIFFYTTDGTYVEWNSEYLMADQPLQLATQPELVRQVK